MSEWSMSANLSGQQFGGQDELLERLPARPKLLRELVVVPAGPDAVTFYGTQKPQTLRCPQGLKKLSELLALLDGRHSLDEISQGLASHFSGGVTGLVSLLFRYGLLEDGDAQSGNDEPVGCYAARFCGSSGYHANRDAAIAQADAVRLLVACPQPVRAALCASLGGGTLGTLRVVHSAAEVAGSEHTHALLVLSGGVEDEELLKVADALHASKRPYFIGTLGSDCMHLGPLVLPGLSASHRCARLQLSAPAPLVDPLEAEFQCAYIAHEWLQIALGLLTETYLNKVRVHPVDSRGAYPVNKPIARIPGSLFGGLATAAYLAPDDAAFAAWVHHVSVRMPPKEWLAPRLFEGHFKMANLKLYGAPVTRSYALGTLTLPAAAELPSHAGGVSVQAACDEPSLAQLAAILLYAVGEQTLEDGSRRRIAPSGGSLRSCSFYVLVNHLAQLASGLYLYDGETDSLIPVKVASLVALRQLLYGTEHAPCPVSLVASSHLGRVRNKYQDFGFNLVHWDAGIACQYATLVASVFGLRVVQPALLQAERCAELLNLNTQENAQIASSVLHLGGPMSAPANQLLSSSSSTAQELLIGAGHTRACHVGQSLPGLVSPSPEGRDNTLDVASLLLGRRATYRYAEPPISTSCLVRLVVSAHRALVAHQERGGPRLDVWPWLLLMRPDGAMTPGIYDCRKPAPEQWVQRASPLTPAMFAECFNQQGFQKAGAALVFMADLEQSFSQMGQPVYPLLLQQAGGAAVATWLEALAIGLVGCTVGGIIEAGFMRLAGTDGYCETPLFSLVLGHPIEDGA